MNKTIVVSSEGGEITVSVYVDAQCIGSWKGGIEAVVAAEVLKKILPDAQIVPIDRTENDRRAYSWWMEVGKPEYARS